jgi:hypothetical protein
LVFALAALDGVLCHVDESVAAAELAGLGSALAAGDEAFCVGVVGVAVHHRFCFGVPFAVHEYAAAVQAVGAVFGSGRDVSGRRELVFAPVEVAVVGVLAEVVAKPTGFDVVSDALLGFLPVLAFFSPLREEVADLAASSAFLAGVAVRVAFALGAVHWHSLGGGPFLPGFGVLCIFVIDWGLALAFGGGARGRVSGGSARTPSSFFFLYYFGGPVGPGFGACRDPVLGFVGPGFVTSKRGPVGPGF